MLQLSTWHILTLELNHLEWVGRTKTKSVAVACPLAAFPKERDYSYQIESLSLLSRTWILPYDIMIFGGTHVYKIFCLKSEY